MSESTAKRRYHAPRRQEQARQTRLKILQAARRLFATDGYAATTLPAIAHEAGVSVPTVTAVFGTKAQLLDALIKLVVRGDTASTPLAEQGWWQQMLAEPDPREQLRRHASGARRIHEQSADVAEIVRGAATADPEIAALLRRVGQGRLQDVHAVAESLADKGALIPGMPIAQATDVLWALGSSELYRSLVAQRGWSPDQYECWLAATLIQSLLGVPWEAGAPATIEGFEDTK